MTADYALDFWTRKGGCIRRGSTFKVFPYVFIIERKYCLSHRMYIIIIKHFVRTNFLLLLASYISNGELKKDASSAYCVMNELYPLSVAPTL